MPEKKKEEEFDPNTTMVGRIVHSKRFSLMAWLTALATVGAAVVALNTFTGLNFRPAWGYETERLAAADVEIKQRLDRVLEIQDGVSRSVVGLKKGQLELRLEQIARQKRELRRELAGHQSTAQQFRDRSEPVPGWLHTAITDAESAIGELDHERGRVESQLLQLEP